MKSVYFIKDFGGKKKGDEFKCDSMLANRLVNEDQVAVYEKPKKEPKK